MKGFLPAVALAGLLLLGATAARAAQCTIAYIDGSGGPGAAGVLKYWQGESVGSGPCVPLGVTKPRSANVTVPIVLAATAQYSAGNLVGQGTSTTNGPLLLTGIGDTAGETVTLQDVKIDTSGPAPIGGMTVWLCSVAPSTGAGSTLTDHAALALAIADQRNCWAIAVGAAYPAGGVAMESATGLGKRLVLPGTTLYALVQSNGTVTPATVNDYSLSVSVDY